MIVSERYQGLLVDNKKVNHIDVNFCKITFASTQVPGVNEVRTFISSMKTIWKIIITCNKGNSIFKSLK